MAVVHEEAQETRALVGIDAAADPADTVKAANMLQAT